MKQLDHPVTLRTIVGLRFLRVATQMGDRYPSYLESSYPGDVRPHATPDDAESA